MGGNRTQRRTKYRLYTRRFILNILIFFILKGFYTIRYLIINLRQVLFSVMIPVENRLKMKAEHMHCTGGANILRRINTNHT